MRKFYGLYCIHSLWWGLTAMIWVIIGAGNALIIKIMGPTWGPSGTDRAQVGPMLAPWTLLSGWFTCYSTLFDGRKINGLAPARCQTLVWRNAELSQIVGFLGPNFGKIPINIHYFSFTKMRLKMLSIANWPFNTGCIVLNPSELRPNILNMHRFDGPTMKTTL